jgi:ribosomal protein S6
MAKQTQASESVRTYEIGYLIAPTVPEGEVADIESELQSAVSDADGEVLASETPEARDLAYTMEVTTSAGDREFERGQFGWVQFEVDANELDAIESTLEDEADVLRSLTIKIDEEAVGAEGNGEEQDEENDEEDDA